MPPLESALAGDICSEMEPFMYSTLYCLQVCAVVIRNEYVNKVLSCVAATVFTVGEIDEVALFIGEEPEFAPEVTVAAAVRPHSAIIAFRGNSDAQTKIHSFDI